MCRVHPWPGSQEWHRSGVGLDLTCCPHVRRHRFDDATGAGTKLEGRTQRHFDVLSPEKVAERDARLAKISARREHDPKEQEFLSKIERYTKAKHERQEVAAQKSSALEKERQVGNRRDLLRHVMLEMITLPRQPRDKHRENSKADTFFYRAWSSTRCTIRRLSTRPRS